MNGRQPNYNTNYSEQPYLSEKGQDAKAKSFEGFQNQSNSSSFDQEYQLKDLGNASSNNFGTRRAFRSSSEFSMHNKTTSVPNAAPVSNPALNRNFASNFQNAQRLRFQQSGNVYSSNETNSLGRLRRPSSSFIELGSKVESGYRKFAPLTASQDPSFTHNGDTLQELKKIFDIIFLNLKFFGQSYMDIAHLQIYVTNSEVIPKVEQSISFHLRGHYPPINFTPSEHLPDHCTIQIITTCFYTPPLNSPFQSYQDINNFTHLSVNEGASGFPRNQNIRFNTAKGSTVVYTDKRPHSTMNSTIAELLPKSLAVAFGYFGTPIEQLKACMMYITVIRCLTSLLGLIDLSIILSTSFASRTLRLGSLLSSIRYLLWIGIMTTTFSLILLIYGLMWLYHKAKCPVKNAVFLQSTPIPLILYFKLFCQLGYYGDKAQMFLLVSSASAVFAVSTILDTAETEQVKRRFRTSAGLGFFLVFLISILSVFCGMLMRTYKMMGYHLPLAPEVPHTHANSSSKKKDELVELLTQNPPPTFNQAHSHEPTQYEEVQPNLESSIVKH